MVNPYIIFSTVPTKKQGQKIADVLLQNRLAACVSILSGISSKFLWKGKMDQAKEFLLVIKTDGSKFKKIEHIIKENHSYSVPEIIGWPVQKGSKQYLDWIRVELGIKGR